MRLSEDIALLERAATIAGKAIWPEAENERVPAGTLATVCEEVEQRRGAPAEYTLIRDEAVWLLQAARNVVIYRDDANAPMIERWTRLAELLAAGIALDLTNARKSLEALG